jgi:YggT family protein
VVAWVGLIQFIAGTLQGLLWAYFWIVIIAAFMSWINPDPYNPIVRFIYSITEPVFDFVREHLPVVFGGIDFSPLVVIIAVQFFQRYLIPVGAYYLTGGFA